MTVARAAVDSGTNSTRLLIVDAAGDVVARRTEITRLGRGVDRTGRLDDAALERTLRVIERYRDEWRAHGVDAGHVRIAATSAIRDAADRDRYFAAVRDRTGVDAEVLSGEDEAALSFRGAVGALTVDEPVGVVDVGGGSTELVVGARGAVHASWSLQLGSVRVTERHLHGDPPTPEEIEQARRMIDEARDVADRKLSRQGTAFTDSRTVVGVAGTATTIAALHLGLETFDEARVHGVRLQQQELRSWANRLLDLPASERRTLGPIPAGREDVIAAGALILAEILEPHPAGELVVSAADVLDGLVDSLRDEPSR